MVSNQRFGLPPLAGLGFGGGAGRTWFGLLMAGIPVPAGLAGGAFFAACFSLLAFCRQSGQVTSFALADWNHLPQVLHRIFVLLMRESPRTTKNLLASECTSYFSPLCSFCLPPYYRGSRVRRPAFLPIAAYSEVMEKATKKRLTCIRQTLYRVRESYAC